MERVSIELSAGGNENYAMPRPHAAGGIEKEALSRKQEARRAEPNTTVPGA